MPTKPHRLCFFLGGRDLEMQAIAELVEATLPGDQIVNHGLVWGAKASAYAADLARCRQRGLIPVLVELEPDMPLPPHAVLIDHHGPAAGRDRPTSLEQVFALLGLPPERWTRRLELVAANDRGHVKELQSRGASRDEIRSIRAADRAAQGILPADEAAALTAVAQARTECGGRLTIVELPHSKTATVADRLEPVLGGPGYENLVIGHPGGTAFFGAGWLIDTLRIRFPDGWWGGSLPDRGFWGGPHPASKVTAHIRDQLQEPDPLDSEGGSGAGGSSR